jgi:hypothetical protein
MNCVICPPNATAPSISSVSPNGSSIFLPKEHGSWSLALEPVMLGLLIAPSSAGMALAGTAIAGFFARRPLKAAFGPHAPNRRWSARLTLIMFAGLVLTGIAETVLLTTQLALWPLLLALPLGAMFVYFDARGDSRATAAELAGSSAFAVLPAAMATLAGWSTYAALSLATLAAVRSVPTVLTLRAYLRMSKGKPVIPAIPLVAAILGLSMVTMLAAERQVPWLSTFAAFILLLRTGWLMTPLRPKWTARRLGITEAAAGVGYVTVVAVAYQLW